MPFRTLHQKVFLRQKEPWKRVLFLTRLPMNKSRVCHVRAFISWMVRTTMKEASDAMSLISRASPMAAAAVKDSRPLIVSSETGYRLQGWGMRHGV